MDAPMTSRWLAAATFIAHHLRLAAAWVAAASSAAGVYIACAVKAERMSRRAAWGALALWELGNAVGIIRAMVEGRQRP
ncbi:MAG: hypothetical protein WAL84_01055 [Candidatus Dormiibacterota bacterium]